MAMTSGPDPVHRAMLELRAEADRWWALVAPRVRARALQAGGRREVAAGSVRALAPGGPVAVACPVLVAELARAVHEVPGAEPEDVLLELGPGDPANLLGVGLVVVAAPEPLQDLASRLRRAVADRLRELLGPVLPEPVERLVRVRVEDLVLPAAGPPAPGQPAAGPRGEGGREERGEG